MVTRQNQQFTITQTQSAEINRTCPYIYGFGTLHDFAWFERTEQVINTNSFVFTFHTVTVIANPHIKGNVLFEHPSQPFIPNKLTISQNTLNTMLSKLTDKPLHQCNSLAGIRITALIQRQPIHRNRCTAIDYCKHQ